ncbi:MAG TPA: GlxA family transcriptional regulator [Acidimicrobiales bacterium]|nr:GlxA family transcriptional regulator [Acidimicrobiales bacterium]
MTTRRVVVVGYEDMQILDLTGPMEVFAMANRQVPASYAVDVVSPGGGAVRASSGLEVTMGPLPRRTAIDTLLVVGGTGTPAAMGNDTLIRWIKSAATRSRRVTSVCSGAFVLAAAGLLDGKRATTHWSECHTLAEFFPKVTVEADPIFVHDGDVWTSAGVTAGMDLALALVEDDLGADVAREVARWLVLFVQRPGGQSQFSAQLAAQQPERDALRDVTEWMTDHLASDLSVAALARRAGMSTRNFARAFRAELGHTPASYAESLRVEAARRLLESTDRTVDDIARACGFGTVETMHRTFKRTVRVTPGEYRRHFQCAS